MISTPAQKKTPISIADAGLSNELLFQWIKQALKITRFVGVSENAVRIQIAVALIIFTAAKPGSGSIKSHPKPSSLHP